MTSAHFPTRALPQTLFLGTKIPFPTDSQGFTEKIIAVRVVPKTQKSALLVLWKGVINPELQSLVNQYFPQRENFWLTKFEKLFSKKNHEK